jgi:hypothetical protein
MADIELSHIRGVGDYHETVLVIEIASDTPEKVLQAARKAVSLLMELPAQHDVGVSIHRGSDPTSGSTDADQV